MTDEDILLEGETEAFGAGVVGVCDICKTRQAVIVLTKERFKLCVLDFLNKSWIRTNAPAEAHTAPFRSSTEYLPCRSVPGGQVPVIILSPLKEVKRPSVLVVPEVYGLTWQVIEAGVRLAHAGYEVAIPDFVRIHGVNLWTAAKLRASKILLERVHVSLSHRERALRILEVTRKYLLSRPLVNPERQAVVGISYGGTLALGYAAQTPSIKGVALAYPYMIDPPSYLQFIKCPILVIAGGDDARVGPSVHELHARAHAYGVNLGTFIVPGARHHFLSREHSSYDPVGAELAWSRMIAFVNHCLNPPAPKLPTRPPVPPPVAASAKPAAAASGSPTTKPAATPPSPPVAPPPAAPPVRTPIPAARPA